MIGDAGRLEIHDRRLEMTRSRLRLEDEWTLRQLGWVCKVDAPRLELDEPKAGRGVQVGSKHG